MVRINGKDENITEGTKLSQYLKDSGYNRERLAVEINGVIIPKKNYDETVLNDGDKIEVVSFVGGG